MKPMLDTQASLNIGTKYETYCFKDTQASKLCTFMLACVSLDAQASKIMYILLAYVS